MIWKVKREGLKDCPDPFVTTTGGKSTSVHCKVNSGHWQTDPVHRRTDQVPRCSKNSRKTQPLSRRPKYTPKSNTISTYYWYHQFTRCCTPRGEGPVLEMRVTTAKITLGRVWYFAHDWDYVSRPVPATSLRPLRLLLFSGDQVLQSVDRQDWNHPSVLKQGKRVRIREVVLVIDVAQNP